MTNEEDVSVDDSEKLSDPVESVEPESNGEILLLWIKEDENHVVTTIYIYQDPVTKRMKNVMPEPNQFLQDQGLIEYPVETRWTVPTRGQLDGYRTSSARYNTVARAVLFQRAAVEELLIKNHLQEIIVGQEGHKTSLVIERDNRGRLSKESQVIIDQLHPSVMDMTMAKFIEDAALILF